MNSVVALITAITAAIGAIGSIIAVIASFYNASATRSIKLEINGRMSELLANTKEAAWLDGHHQGRVTAVAEQATRKSLEDRTVKDS